MLKCSRQAPKCRLEDGNWDFPENEKSCQFVKAISQRFLRNPDLNAVTGSRILAPLLEALNVLNVLVGSPLPLRYNDRDNPGFSAYGNYRISGAVAARH